MPGFVVAETFFRPAALCIADPFLTFFAETREEADLLVLDLVREFDERTFVETDLEE